MSLLWLEKTGKRKNLGRFVGNVVALWKLYGPRVRLRLHLRIIKTALGNAGFDDARFVHRNVATAHHVSRSALSGVTAAVRCGLFSRLGRVDSKKLCALTGAPLPCFFFA